MRSRVAKARVMKMCVVAISTYFSSLRETASSAAVTEDDVIYEFASVFTTVKSYTIFWPTCQETTVKPSDSFPSVRERPTGSLTKAILAPINTR